MPEDAPSPTDGDLLVAAPEAWREVCFSLPAVRALAAAGHRPTILCAESQAAFWQAAGFDSLCRHPDQATPRRIAPLLRSYGSIVLWEAGRRAEAAARAGVARRIGIPVAGLGKLLTEPQDLQPPPGPPRHAVEPFLELAQRLGAAPLQAEHFRPIPVVADGARADEVLVIPGSGFGAHFEWPVERWREVVEGLRQGGRRVRIGGDDPAGRALAGDGTALALDPARPAELAGFRLCLAADGPLPHLAAAFGTTCVVLFGPGDPALHRPLGRAHRIVRRKVECSPCFANRCRLDLRCQQELDPAAVLAAALELSAASGT